MANDHVDKIISHLFRTESGKMASVLVRMLGLKNIGVAQDIVQDTLLKAVNTWKFKGMPDNPTAWLYAVAKRQAIDYLRQRSRRQHIDDDIAKAFQSEWTLASSVNQFFLPDEIEDSQLRMIFVSCHPAIPYESQIAFTLKTLCGLSVSEIAKAFLTTEDTIAKRIYRAREKIREQNISLDVPAGKELPPRLESVWHTLYLLFNEGYSSSNPDFLIRQELCMEAIRLCLLLTKNEMTNTAESQALLALMCFQASREGARLSSENDIVLLQDQDRSKWDQELIQKGFDYLDLAATQKGRDAYFLQAAIAGIHAKAKTFFETDWISIRKLYELLVALKPDPIVRLNMAVATAYAVSASEALKEISLITELDRSLLFHTAKGDFHRLNKDFKLAAECYQTAMELTESNYQKDLLLKKLESVSVTSHQ